MPIWPGDSEVEAAVLGEQKNGVTPVEVVERRLNVKGRARVLSLKLTTVLLLIIES